MVVKMTFRFGVSEVDPVQDPDEKSANESLRDVIYGLPKKTKGLDESGGVPKPASDPGSVREAMRTFRTEVSKPLNETAKTESDSSKLVKGKSETNDTVTRLSKQFSMTQKVGNETWIYNKTPWTGLQGTQVNVPLIGAFAAKPRTAGAMTMILGTGSMSHDAYNFLNANTSREQIKYGTATMADAEILTGGALMLMGKFPKAGPALVGIGLTARLLVDLLPNDVKR